MDVRNPLPANIISSCRVSFKTSYMKVRMTDILTQEAVQPGFLGRFSFNPKFSFEFQAVNGVEFFSVSRLNRINKHNSLTDCSDIKTCRNDSI